MRPAQRTQPHWLRRSRQTNASGVPTPYRVGLDVLGMRFSLESDDDRWSNFIAELWEPFIAHDRPVGRESTVEARRRQDGWRLDFFGEWSIEATDPWVLASEFRNGLVGRALKGANVVALHAAALGHGDSAVLLVGPSGVGKTTLTLRLLEAGWSYLTDDLAIVTPAGLVRPFPKPLNVKSPWEWKRYHSLWSSPSWLPTPMTNFLVPARCFAHESGKELQPSHVIFLSFRPTSPASVEAVPPGLATGLCAQNVVDPTPRDVGVLRGLCTHGAAAEGSRLIEAIVADDGVQGIWLPGSI
jgi:hypothetical protein